MLSAFRRLLLCVPLALTMLVGTPVGGFRLVAESEEAPIPIGEETSSPDAVPPSARMSRRARHTLQQHFRTQVCMNHRRPASSCAGPCFLAKDGHHLSNGLRAPLLT